MNLARAFATSVESCRRKTAIFWGDSEFTYDTLHRETLKVAGDLAVRYGVRPGDRVGIWLKNCPEFVPAVFGIIHAGAVVVPINNFLKPDEVLHILDDAGIQVLITESNVSEGVIRLQSLCPHLRVFPVETLQADAVAPAEPLPFPKTGQNDLAVIIYTSGTTGKPKGAMLSHGNLLANVNSCRIVLETVESDRFVVLLPMFHSFMLMVGVFLPLTVGGSIVLIKTLHPPKSILAEIMHRQPTILPAIPQFFRTLASITLPPNFPLRTCISGGAPLPVEILREFNAHMPMPLIEGYGLSEASPVVSLNPIHGRRKEGSIGLPISDVEITVQDDTGRQLPAGETGEICVRGPNVMLGYWNKPEETARVLRNGWLLTGDIGHADADGYYFVTDRKKDMLLVNGINVYPREIEEILYQFPGVREAAVVGIPDQRRGEQPLAFVSASDGATVPEKALLQFVRERLADYKVPRRVVFLPSLPRNATGKILKTMLRQQVAAIPGRET